MPPAFDPDLTRQRLRPFTTAENGPIEQAYRQYYGLDLEMRYPGLDIRLGHFKECGLRLAAQAWLLPEAKASLLFMHGYYDHMGLYRHLVDWALSMGFSVLACDLPGHGLSEGSRASIDDFSEYQRVWQALLALADDLAIPAPWHLCGQSTGGAILLDYLLQGGRFKQLGETILLAPLVRPRSWRISKLTYHLLNPFIRSIPRRFTDNSCDPTFLHFVREDPLQPMLLPTAWVGALARWIPLIERSAECDLSPLIVQGEADLTVDWRHNLKILSSKFDQPRICLLPDARHHLINETASLREQYFGFLRQHLTASS